MVFFVASCLRGKFLLLPDTTDEPAYYGDTPAGSRRGDIGGDRRVDFGQRPQHFALDDGDRHAVAVDETAGGGCADPFSRRHDAGQVQGIGAADREQPAIWSGPPDFAQAIDRVRQRELLAGESCDEASSANFAARLETT